MDITISWLIGIIVALAGVGIGLLYQGEALEKPEQSKSIGRRMRTAGYSWIGIASFYILVVIILQVLKWLALIK